ncbi:MAG: excinuclease ABC subunit UvrC, partial [Ectothiorhodospiraceae bacterium]|nr:excinuclease ABC subunit UvrC [Ectothiorhodospiraceae bacterium]
YITGERGDLDVVACVSRESQACVQVFFVRQGQNLGNKAFFPRIPPDTSEAEVLSAFLARYYLGRPAPRELLLNLPIEDEDVLEEALQQQNGRAVQIRTRVRGERRRWLEMAVNNAQEALQARAASSASLRRRFEELQQLLDLDDMPQRLECFDISHTQGEATVASCVVFNQEGPLKSDYRRFNIEGVTPGDDYAAMRQALTRRYTRLRKGEGVLPDLLVIDGGRGQLAQAVEVLEELQVEGVTLLGIAKGPDRKPGLEKLILPDRPQEVILPPDSAALHLLQQLRDEAHRFASTGPRQRRGKARRTSSLEQVAGLGPKRRQMLLKQFGGLQGIARAGVEDLQSVRGVSRELAQRIYDAFHNEAG